MVGPDSARAAESDARKLGACNLKSSEGISAGERLEILGRQFQQLKPTQRRQATLTAGSPTVGIDGRLFNRVSPRLSQAKLLVYSVDKLCAPRLAT
jgi:hypothetical protein